MKVQVKDTVELAAQEAANLIAAEARQAVAERGRFTLAVSGGNSPLTMFRALADLDIPWEGVHVFQVDERVAPVGHSDRNLTQLSENLLELVPLPEAQVHAIPVEFPDLQGAAADYAATLKEIAGNPPVLDFIHLGLGADGHTASLIPNDPVLDVADTDIALTRTYQGRRRLTMTYPALNRARRLLWFVAGEDKAEALARMLKQDISIPAGRVGAERAIVIADRAAAAMLS